MRIKNICLNCSQISYKNDNICPICGYKFTKVSITDSLKLNYMDRKQIIKWIEKKVGHPLNKENLAKQQKHIDKALQEFNQRKEAHQAKLKAEQEAKLKAMTQKALDKVNNIPKCPICGSTNINKITLTTRAVKTAAFGVVGAVDDAGKTYKCGNCGSRF